MRTENNQLEETGDKLWLHTHLLLQQSWVWACSLERNWLDTKNLVYQRRAGPHLKKHKATDSHLSSAFQKKKINWLYRILATPSTQLNDLPPVHLDSNNSEFWDLFAWFLWCLKQPEEGSWGYLPTLISSVLQTVYSELLKSQKNKGVNPEQDRTIALTKPLQSISHGLIFHHVNKTPPQAEVREDKKDRLQDVIDVVQLLLRQN